MLMFMNTLFFNFLTILLDTAPKGWSDRVEEKCSFTSDVAQVSSYFTTPFFPSMFFCGEATKKTSIDGLKWRDLVGGRWWLVNFKVSGVTKGFTCNTPQDSRHHVNVTRGRGQPIPPQSYSISK